MGVALNLLLKQTRNPSKREHSRSCSSPENEPERQELSLPSALLHWNPRKSIEHVRETELMGFSLEILQ